MKHIFRYINMQSSYFQTICRAGTTTEWRWFSLIVKSGHVWYYCNCAGSVQKGCGWGIASFRPSSDDTACLLYSIQRSKGISVNNRNVTFSSIKHYFVVNYFTMNHFTMGAVGRILQDEKLTFALWNKNEFSVISASS